MKTTTGVLLLCGLVIWIGLAPAHAVEFNGPFPSWGNVKTAFGAVGDGKADDTAALQKGLDALSPDPNKIPVLYLPPGTYRITSTLTVTGHGIMNGMVSGDDPNTTIIKWDGPLNGTMLRGTGGLSYMKFARLTWDGSGKALAAVDHAWIVPPAGNICGTHNVHEDEIFKDVGFGIRAGEASKQGSGMDAETLVLRCQFLRCWSAGLSIESFNALDWWLINCQFLDCRVGATNRADGEYGGGHFHIYHSLFRNSSEADIIIGHASYFGFRYNTSIGSAAFLLQIRPSGVISNGMDAGTGMGGWSPTDTWSSPIMVQGNTILDPREPAAIRIFSNSQLILLDNTIRTRPGVHTGPVVYLYGTVGKPDLFAVGNTFTVDNPFGTDARTVDVDNKTVPPEAIPDSHLVLPTPAAKVVRPIFEVPAGATTDAIQAVINQAAQKTGQRPVVHFPAGTYAITQTLTLPANSDVQLVGDAWHTSLTWKGPAAQPLLHIEGPTKATLSDLQLSGGSPCLLATDCDQPGAGVHGEMLNPDAATGYGFTAENVDNLRVDLWGDMNNGTMISGGPRTRAGEKTPARLALIGGASSDREQLYNVADGARMAVWDTWYEGGTAQFLKLEGQGALALSGGEVAEEKSKPGIPEIEVGAFTGRFFCQGLSITPAAAALQVDDTARDASVLAVGNLFWSLDAFANKSTTARVEFLLNREVTQEKGQTTLVPYENQGLDSPEFIREMLQDIRGIVPDWELTPTGPGVTDLRLYRVWTTGGLVLRGGK